MQNFHLRYIVYRFSVLSKNLILFKVHALNEEKFRPYKKIDQLELIEQESEDALDQVYDDSEASTSLIFQVSFIFRSLNYIF